MHKIRENIYLGSRHDLSKIKDSPITAILNLTPDVPRPSNNIVFVRVAMRDDAFDVHVKNDEAVDALTNLLRQGHTVLVHCRQGKSRSPHIVAETIAQMERKDYFKVYEEIREIRPEVLAYSIGQEIVDKGFSLSATAKSRRF